MDIPIMSLASGRLVLTVFPRYVISAFVVIPKQTTKAAKMIASVMIVRLAE
jgi:hypothetical protein